MRCPIILCASHVFIFQSIIRESQDEVVNSDSESLRLLLELDGHLRSLLSQWFSLGFLDLQRITWESPCDIIEKVCITIMYELIS